MKKKLWIIAIIFTLCLTVLSACDAREAGSLQALTNPYIAQYECTEAKLGDEDLLEKFDYIKIVLEDKEKMQLIYKTKNGDKQIIESDYSFDLDSRELTSEIWILGYRFKQSTTVKNGKFNITKPIDDKLLVLKFESK